MIITTAQGARFDTQKYAKSPVIKVLDGKGGSVMDVLRITGNMTTVNMQGQPVSMVEVEHSFGTDEVNENFLTQL
jgi:hypothetical protein